MKMKYNKYTETYTSENKQYEIRKRCGQYEIYKMTKGISERKEQYIGYARTLKEAKQRLEEIVK